MEALRPQIDRFVLDLLEHRRFRKQDFGELPSGQVRLSSALAKEVSLAVLPGLETLATDVVTEIVEALGVEGAGRIQRRRRPTRGTTDRVMTPLRPRLCERCGSDLGSSRRKLCDECLAPYRTEKKAVLGRSGPEHFARLRTSNDPDAVAARAKRNESLSRRMLAIRQWEQEHGTDCDWDLYEREIVPIIETLSAYDLVRITGLSSGYCKEVKRGLKRLHPIHWEVVLGLRF